MASTSDAFEDRDLVPGWVLTVADYDQVERRVLAH